MATANTIAIEASESSPMLETYVAAGGASILPGSLIDLLDDGTGTVHLYSGLPGIVSPFLIAVENLSEGKTVADAYVANEKIYYRHFRPGDVCRVRFGSASAVPSGKILQSLGGAINPGMFVVVATAHQWEISMGYAHESDAAGSVGRLIKMVVK